MATRQRCLGLARLSRRLAAGRRRHRQPPRRRHGQALRHRIRAEGDRRCGPAARRRRRHPGVKVEALYRDIRALRIYEGASEVQRQIIARDMLKERRAMKILQPEGWPRPKGYSNGMSRARADDLHRRRGRLGRARELPRIHAPRPVRAGACATSLAILACDGAGPEHIVRMTCYVTDRHEYLAGRDEIGAAWREIMGANYPAMALVEVSAPGRRRGQGRDRGDRGGAGVIACDSPRFVRADRACLPRRMT